MTNHSKKYITDVGVSFLVIFLIFFAMGSKKDPIVLELKKASYPFVKSATSSEQDLTNKSSLISSYFDEEETDTSKNMITKELISPVALFSDSSVSDSSNKENILLIGDSQLEGLRNPVYNYCIWNKQNLKATILWYGSSTKQWATTDTLDYYIKKFKPSLVMMAIGLNELFVNDLDNRKIYIDTILRKFKKHKVKFVWIGPAAWTKDKGIIDVMKHEVGLNFYPSNLLTLDRADDNRHPSRKAAKIWFDSVAVYVTKYCKIDFSVKPATLTNVENSPLIMLMQPK